MNSTDNIAVMSILRTPKPDTDGNYSFAVSIAFTATARMAGRQHSIRANYRKKILQRIRMVECDEREPAIVNSPVANEAIFCGKPGQVFETMHIASRPEASQRHRDKLTKFGRAITYPIGEMRDILSFLFTLEGRVSLVQICTNEESVQWDWIQDEESGRLLCEVFGVGVTYATERFSYAQERVEHSVSREKLAGTEHTALIVANSYSNRSDLLLPGIDREIRRVKKTVANAFGGNSTTLLLDAECCNIERAIRDGHKTHRLIVLMGHFNRDGFETVDDIPLSPDRVRHCLQRNRFEREPIVVLNGCAGKQDSENNFSIVLPDENPNQRLVEEFINGNAGGCVVTSTQIHLDFATSFLSVFLNELLTAGVPLGTALLNTRRQFQIQDCYEWAAYHLVGDPLDRIISAR